MIPQKIEIAENKGIGYNVAILGVGTIGRETVSNYPYQSYEKKQWIIENLLLCDDETYQKQICDIVKRSEILFVVVDMSIEADFRSAIHFAKMHKGKEHEDRYTVLVDCSQEGKSSNVTLSIFDLIVLNPSHAPSYRPIEMLLTDMYTQFYGVDIPDVKAILDHTPEVVFLEDSFCNYKELEKIACCFKTQIANDILNEDIFNALLYFSFSSADAIEVFQEGSAVLSRLDINGDFMAQVGIDARLNDVNTVSLMYGKDQLR
jgi:hypothetical protein